MSVTVFRCIFLYILFLFPKNVVDSSSDSEEEPFPTVGKILSPESFKVFTYTENNLNNLKENEDSHYRFVNTGSSFSYEFNSDVKCNEVKYKDRLIWIYLPKESENGFPEKIIVDSHIFVVFLVFQDLLKLYKCDENICRLISEKQSSELNSSKLGLYTTDLENLVKLDPSKIQNNHGFEIHYNLSDQTNTLPDSNELIKCTEIQYSYQTLWKYGLNESGDKYPYKVYFNSFIGAIILDFQKIYVIYKYDGTHFHSSSTDALYGSTESEFKLIGENDLEITKTEYEIIKYPHDNAFAFQFKQDSRCTEIRFKDKSFWKNLNQEQVPELLYINFSKRLVMIQTQVSFLVYTYTDRWTLIFEGNTQLRDIADDKPQEIKHEEPKDITKDEYVFRLGKKPFRIMEFSSKTKTILVLIGIFLLFLIIVCLIIFIK
ncbi:hypothetical protein TpMuguga_02g00950 [Theileria parva strain Muguga]|uniref:Uncharacterized protein n=1 Tax=Theileria parva TaxID=5875 RepID=Q4N3N9_THEPA|nr:uncharacterized protein TpMuguga_02g00950 [Theileria parva strain Muguga]EAN33234.1 hypothetical protein TpMuguga_02g00950 [Theileria parva strain Muguga]|eukprot:XP_765517.1 hypothetical protein [Theileria parva strain Muguga]